MGRLDGKVFLAFGSSSGLGKETVELLASKGSKVVVTDRPGAKAAEVAEQINKSGGTAVHTEADVTVDGHIQAAVDFAVKEYGKIDMMLYAPGLTLAAPILEIPVEHWNTQLQVHLIGSFLAVQATARQMKKNGGGSIVVISSLNSTLPSYGLSAYCASKAGIDMMVKVAAMELGPDIRINSINPGFIYTVPTSQVLDVPACMEAVKANTALKRAGVPNDFAKTAMFLLSDESSYFTGQNLFPDGGMSCYGYPDIAAAFAKAAAEQG